MASIANCFGILVVILGMCCSCSSRYPNAATAPSSVRDSDGVQHPYISIDIDGVEFTKSGSMQFNVRMRNQTNAALRISRYYMIAALQQVKCVDDAGNEYHVYGKGNIVTIGERPDDERDLLQIVQPRQEVASTFVLPRGLTLVSESDDSPSTPSAVAWALAARVSVMRDGSATLSQAACVGHGNVIVKW